MDELILNNVKVEWVEIGEGRSGYYNPDDPDDVELLRFYVSTLVDGEWQDVHDGSYCTNFPYSATPEQRKKALEKIMDSVYEPLTSDSPYKKILERMSWIGLDDIE